MILLLSDELFCAFTWIKVAKTQIKSISASKEDVIQKNNVTNFIHSGKGKRHSITSKVHQGQPTLLQYLKQPHYLRLFLSIHPINRLFAASHSSGTKPPCWRTKVALGQDKQKAYMSLNDNFLCLTCPARLLLFSKER